MLGNSAVDSIAEPSDVFKWLESEALVPPVCSKCICRGTELEAMVVGGPNDRTDFHINPTEEFFFQVRGTVRLVLVDDTAGSRSEVEIKEGECFVLPAMVPHSPRRGPDSLGLVIERRRSGEQMDALAWYCFSCNRLLKMHPFLCTDLERNIQTIISGQKIEQLCDACRKR